VARWFPEVTIDLGRPVAGLPMADQKIIEIVRALRGDVALVILDEPTATLPAREKEQLWGIIRSLPRQGVGVVLISHFLSEIKALSDRITVLRDGRLICTEPAADLAEAQLVDMMLRRTGGSDPGRGQAAGRDLGAVALSVRDWQVGSVHRARVHPSRRRDRRPHRPDRVRPLRLRPARSTTAPASPAPPSRSPAAPPAPARPAPCSRPASPSSPTTAWRTR
jgi:hypothetical protein